MVARPMVLTTRFAASCRELQAGSLCSPEADTAREKVLAAVAF